MVWDVLLDVFTVGYLLPKRGVSCARGVSYTPCFTVTTHPYLVYESWSDATRWSMSLMLILLQAPTASQVLHDTGMGDAADTRTLQTCGQRDMTINRA